MGIQFETVSSKYGAPMGRSSYGKVYDCPPKNIKLFQVHLTGDYDDGGAYWGYVTGKPIYCAVSETTPRYRAFTRASDRLEAAKKLGIGQDQLILKGLRK